MQFCTIKISIFNLYLRIKCFLKIGRIKMNEITMRDRLFAALEGKILDRVPTWLLFPYHKTGYYADVRNNACYKKIHELSMSRAIILNRRNIGTNIFTEDVKKTEEIIDVEKGKVKKITYSYNNTKIFSNTPIDDNSILSKKFLNDEEDLEKYLSFPILLDPTLIRKELELQLPQYLKELAEFPFDAGSMMLDLGEPICRLYHDSNLSEYPIWSITQHDAVKSFLSQQMERLRIIYKWALENNLADVYFLIGSELASPPMVSVDTFNSWIIPYTKELIDLIHSYGKKAIVHYHGQIREILPYLAETNPDAIHTIEAPPVGNCTLAEAFDITKNKITLIGNIQYDCFRSYSTEEMRNAVKDVIAEAGQNRFILSPSAGPYEQTISEKVQENYIAFLEAGWEFGKFKV